MKSPVTIPKFLPLALLLALIGRVAGVAAPRQFTSLQKSPESNSEVRGFWRLSLGGTRQDTGRLSIQGGSFSRINLLSRRLLSSEAIISNAGPAGSFSNRSYDDGYVRLSRGTGDPAAIDPAATSNWGYSRSDQVRGDTLRFHLSQTTNTTSSEVREQENDWNDDDDSIAPNIRLEYLVPIRGGFRVGPQFAFSFNSIRSSHSGSTFSATQVQTGRRDELTDVYELHGVLLPDAPYNGSFTGPGALIDNIPARRTLSTSPLASESAHYRNLVSERIELDFYDFSLGIGIEHNAGDRLYIFAGAGLALRIANYEGSFDEILLGETANQKSQQVKRWSKEADGWDTLWGGYVQGGLGVRMTEDLSLTAFVRYDWLQSLNASFGPSSFDWKPNGLSAGLALSVSF